MDYPYLLTLGQASAGTALLGLMAARAWQADRHLLREAGLRVARHVMASFIAAFHALVRTPGQGHRREDLSSREELRFWNVFSYLIVYRIDKRPLTVIAILHGARDVERLLEDR